MPERIQQLPLSILQGRTRKACRDDRPRHHGLPHATRDVEVEQVEHRLFSFISMNWRGKPLTTYRTVVELIAATTTRTGLTVQASLDTSCLSSLGHLTSSDISFALGARADGHTLKLHPSCHHDRSTNFTTGPNLTIG